MFFRDSCYQNIKTGEPFLGKKPNKTLCKTRNADLFNTDTTRHSYNGCFLYRISLCLLFPGHKVETVYVKRRDSHTFLQRLLRIYTKKCLVRRVDLNAPPATSSRGQQIRREWLVVTSVRQLFFAAKLPPMAGCSVHTNTQTDADARSLCCALTSAS